MQPGTGGEGEPKRKDAFQVLLRLLPTRPADGYEDEAVFMTNGLPPPGPLLIHTLLDCR